MKTRLCDVLGVRRPFISAPLGGAAGPELVAAVCEAGGYGVIPLWGDPVEEVLAGIAKVREGTAGNFAVNLNMSFPHDDALQACTDAGVHGVSLFWGHDPKAYETAKSAGLVVLTSVGNAEEARIAEDAGADVIVAQGWEAGGHVWGQVATMALIPACVDAVGVPVVAAGGIADGRGMAGALMLGAEGVWVGTRLLASPEATIHEEYQAAILASSGHDTEWYADLYDGQWPDAPHRALKNATSKAWQAAGSAKPGSRPDEGKQVGTKPNGAPVPNYESYTPGPGTTGDIAAMSLWSGQGVSVVRKVMPVGEIVAEICDDAARIIRGKGAELGLG